MTKDEARSSLSEDQAFNLARALPRVTSVGEAFQHLPKPSEIDPATPRLIIGEYAPFARLPSSEVSVVLVGVRPSSVVEGRFALIKWVPRSRPGYDELRRALLDEARAHGAVEHPNVVRLLDGGEEPSGAYLVQELVRGLDLATIMTRIASRNQRLSVEHALFVTIEVLRGLAHVHKATAPDGTPLNIVHRDLNPSNVLVANTGHIKITDFGMVMMRDRVQAATQPGFVKGKIRYMAPEYITEQAVTQRLDIYGVGVMLFELLAGRPWLSGTSGAATMRTIVHEGLPSDVLGPLGIPPELEAVVTLATEHDAWRRFASAQEMCAGIEAWLIQRGVYVSISTFGAQLRWLGLLEG